MKRFIALALAMIMMVFVLTACGEDDPAPSGGDGTKAAGTQQTGTDTQKPDDTSDVGAQETEQPSKTPDDNTPSGGSEWNKAEYAEYTNGVVEPGFNYTITGIIGNMGLNFKSSASNDEIGKWKQALLDSGFEENSVAGDTWTVYNDTHSIAHSGGGYFNIQTK